MKKIIIGAAMLAATAGISQAALVGEWKFEGGTATDTSGNGNDGTIIGSVSSASGVEAGTTALVFNATSGYVDIPAAAFANVGEEISISMWTFGDDVLGVSAACSGFGSNSRDMLHSHAPWKNGAIYWDAGGVRHNYVADASKYKGRWNHLVYTMNTVTGDKKVYINGVQDSPDWNADLTSLSGAITSFAIGGNGGANRYYGKLDEFQLYNHELSAAEVSNLYASVEIDSYAVATISASETSGVAPMEVIFHGTNSTASGEITSYEWDFGDGTTATGALVTNTYTLSGTYTSELVIATSEGLTSTSTVEIAAFNYVGVDLAVSVEYREDADADGTQTNAPSFYTDDLGQTGTPTFEGDGEGAGTVGNLFNGSVTSQARWNSTSVKTINLDISSNPLGYDITQIDTIAGWGVAGGGRANQQFGMSVAYVDGSEAILVDAQNWAPNNDPSYYWTKVSFAETNGLPVARGVKAITWYDFSNANAGSVVIAREFDVLGSPTTENYIFAGIAASSKEGPPPMEVAFDGSSSYSSTNIVSYAWDFGDGNVDAGAVVTNTYSTSGAYTAELIVTDTDGAMATNSVVIDVYDVVDAVAEATPLTGNLPLDVVFVATNSSSSGTIQTYAWDFGDGNSASGSMVTNTYNLSDTYTATLTVTDSNGLVDSNSVEIAVSKAVSANFIQYSETYNSNNIPSVSTNDLAQTHYLSSEGSGGNEAARHAQLFNGLIGNTDGNTGGDGEVRLGSGEAITVTFDTSVNTLGYDIDMIETFAGWTPTIYTETQTNNLSRSNQGYELIVGFADGSFGSFAGPEHWEPNGDAVWTNSVGQGINDQYWTKVGFMGVDGDPMLRNVSWITFNISQNAQAGGIVIYREFDVFGLPSTAYLPSEIVIGSMNGGESMSWASDGAYTYGVQSNLNLQYGQWGTFTNVVGTPPETSIELPKNADAMFFRVIAE